MGLIEPPQAEDPTAPSPVVSSDDVGWVDLLPARGKLRPLALRLLLLLAVIATATIFAQRVLEISADDIEDRVRAAGVLGPAVYSLVLFLGLSVPFNPVSDLATVNVAALVFEPEVSVLATFVAHTISLSVNYLVARRYGPRLLRRVSSERGVEVFDRLGRNFSYRTVFALRFALPLTAIGIDVVSYLAGMRGLRFARFYLASIVPWTILSVVYFTSTAYLRDQSLLLFFVPALVLILGPSLFLLLRRRRRALAPG